MNIVADDLISAIVSGIVARVLRMAAICCFVYIVLRPVSANEILVPILAILGLVAALTVLLGRRRLAPVLRQLIFFQALFGGLGSLVGIINHNPGLVDHVLVYLMAPVLFWTCVMAVDERMLKSILKWCAIATSILATAIVLYVAGQEGLFPDFVPRVLLEQSGAGITTSAGATAIRFYGLSSLVAAGPLWVASLFVPADRLMPGRRLRIYAASVSTLAALLGGRRAIVVVIVIAPLFLWVCGRVVGRARAALTARPRRRSQAVLLTGAIILLLVAALASTSRVTSTSVVASSFRGAQDLLFGRDDTETSGVRNLEARQLLSAWSHAPFIGRGFGATLDGFASSYERPWNFELQYHLLLLQTGLVGVSILLAALWIGWAALRKAVWAAPDLSGTLVITMVGAVGIIFANASNPYLQAPGHMLWVYLPIAVANVMLLSARGRGSITVSQEEPTPVRERVSRVRLHSDNHTKR